VETTPVQSGNDGTVNVFIFGGTPPYEVTLDGQTGTSPFTELPADTFQVTVTDTMGCSTSTIAIIDGSTFIEHEGGDVLSIFPNPSQGWLSVTTSREVSDLRLMDVNGRLVASITVQQLPALLDLSHIAPGTYFMEGSEGGSPKYRASFILLAP
jgi:hypothetical protein